MAELLSPGDLARIRILVGCVGDSVHRDLLGHIDALTAELNFQAALRVAALTREDDEETSDAR